jgi:ribosomal protein S18 acetylase RimI-like enzyme
VRLHHGFDDQRFLLPDADPEAGYAWFLGTQLKADDVLVLVAERDRVVVGYVYAGIEPRSWRELRGEAGFIHDIAVAEHGRRTGVATALVEASVSWFRARGIFRVMLWTAQKNEGAQRLFERLGFRRTMIEMTREIG